MKKNIKTIGLVLLAASLLLAACRPSPAPRPTETQVDPRPVLTGAAQTAQARLTDMAQMTPSPLPPTSTPTLAPTQAETAAPTVDPAQVTPTTAAATTAPPAPSTGGDKAVFVEDRTIPDGTDFNPGAAFVKTWRVMNTGTTTWTGSYVLAFVSGSQMGAPQSVPVPMEVAPNTWVDISVNMTAPAETGNHRGYWRMRNPSGASFGDQFYVDIDVVGSGTPLATTAVTPGAATATQSAGSSLVSNVTMSVENPTVTGACPNTYNLTANFTLSESATVTYQLEAGSNTPGFSFTLPGANSQTYSAGTHTLTFSLSLSNSGSGWFQLHITEPQDIVSNQAQFSLTCQ